MSQSKSYIHTTQCGQNPLNVIWGPRFHHLYKATPKCGPRSGTSPCQSAHKKQTPLDFISRPKTFTIPDQKRRMFIKLSSLLREKYFNGGVMNYVLPANV